MKLLEEAGLPPGVINFVPGDAAMISDKLLAHRDLAGVHFTGSTGVFNNMWKTIGASMSNYRSYPRIVGETGGKDFIVAHASADPVALSVAIARGGFEYQGQKCSAASRVYVPQSIWPEVRDRTVAIMKEIKMGDPTDFRNFMGAVIDKRAFDKISEYVTHGRSNAKIIAGGGVKGEDGLFHRAYACRDSRSRATSFFAKRSLVRLSPPTSMTTRNRKRLSPLSIRLRRTLLLVQCSHGIRAAVQQSGSRFCAMLPAIFTSTTSQPAQWLDSSHSVEREARGRTTKRDRSSTSRGGSALGTSRKRSRLRSTIRYPFMAEE